MRNFLNSTLSIATLMLLVGLTSCRPTPMTTTISGTALGTLYHITTVGPMPEGAQADLDSLFAAANQEMSVFDKNSLLSRINRGETDSITHNIAYCIEMAEQVSALSEGAYDITVQPLVEAYGFAGDDPDFTPDLERLLPLVDYRNISIEGGRLVRLEGVQIGLNSIAKGAVVDMAAAYLEGRGVEAYLVEIGGEIFCKGNNVHGQPWRIGVETPFEGNFSAGEYLEAIVAISGKGMATSGNYRNFRTDSLGRKLTHIIDPRTGRNTESNLLSATVVAENCALADAYGTMFIALGYEASVELMEREGIAALLIWADTDGAMHITLSEAMEPYFQEER